MAPNPKEAPPSVGSRASVAPLFTPGAAAVVIREAVERDGGGADGGDAGGGAAVGVDGGTGAGEKNGATGAGEDVAAGGGAGAGMAGSLEARWIRPAGAWRRLRR